MVGCLPCAARSAIDVPPVPGSQTGYKAGSSISYAQIKEHMPSTLDFYKSLPSTIGKIVGEPVDCTRDDDLSSASVLVYEKPGDSIWWHYDVNFYG